MADTVRNVIRQSEPYFQHTFPVS